VATCSRAGRTLGRSTTTAMNVAAYDRDGGDGVSAPTPTTTKTTTKTTAPTAYRGMIRDAATGVERDPTFREARAYSRALGRRVESDDFSGCHRCRAGRGNGDHSFCKGTCAVCPVCVYNVGCGTCCTDMCWCVWGIPCPLYSCITAFACYEYEEDAFISRDKNRQKSCALMPLDPETGRYGVYTTKCAKSGCAMVFDEDAEPTCVAEPMFGRSHIVQI